MKILHCINSISIVGGAEKIVSKLVEPESDMFVLEVFDDIKKSSSIGKFRQYITFAFRLLTLQSKYSLLHFHLFPSFYFSILINRRKVIIHEHNTYNRRRSISFLRPIEKYIYRRANKVICISDAVKDSLEKWCGELNNAVVLNNFTRFEHDFSDNVAPHTDSKVNLMMVASFTEQKRQKELVLALSKLPDNYILHFLGDGPIKNDIINLSSELMIHDKVIFHGNVDNVEDFYKSVDFCILLSNWEGFGMVAVEAASFNKVTLCSNVSGLSEVIVDNDLLISNSATPEELSFRIEDINEKIRANEEYYTAYCKKICDKYSYKTYYDKLLGIYLNSINMSCN